MTADALDLARRAVACPGWRWLPGMLDTDGWRILRGEEASGGASLASADGELMHDRSLSLSVLPDLTDPATVGCLLALVREAWVDAGCWAECDGGDLTRWAVYSPATPTDRWRIGVGTTEAEALVAALEAAT